MRYLSAALLALCIVLFWAVPVFGIADPDTDLEVDYVYAYEDVLEDGDLGVLVGYNIPYAATPDETVTEAYLIVFLDTDDSQIKAIAPFAYNDDGYNYGIGWIYFSAAEVTTYSLSSDDAADYHVWLVGNPAVASGWTGDPPEITANITDWLTSDDGNPDTLLSLRLATIAFNLEEEWGGTTDLIEATAVGNRFTAEGEYYFTNCIAYLRTMCPNLFASGEVDPTLEDLDYVTSFGATLTNGTGTATGSPITLAEGANNVDVTGLGTFTIELNHGTEGTATTDVCTVTGSPVTLRAGTNTITTTTAVGNIVVTVNLVTTQTTLTDTVTGTALDLSDFAAQWGMSTAMASGLVWLLVSVIICAATYKVAPSGKAIMLVFNVCLIGGGVLGLLPLLAVVLLFIGFGGVMGYVVFFRQANV